MNSESLAISVSDVINQRSMGRFQIRAIVLCWFVAVLDGFDTQCLGFLAPSMAGSLGIEPRAFGAVISAGLVGYFFAALTTGPVADRWGRKWPIILSTVTFAAFAVLTARATTLNELLILRFLTGLGLGGAMPNLVALATEYAPRRALATVVTLLFCAMPLGALLGGVTSWVVIPVWGWQAVFYAGGIVPLALAVALIWMLPESVQFLAVRNADPQAVSRVMQRIAPDMAGTAGLRWVSRETKPRHTSVRSLFTDGRASGTILLWIPVFLNLLMLYFLVSWLPSLMLQQGMAMSAGIMAVVTFSVGGILGDIAQGPMMNKWGGGRVVAAEFASCTLLIGLLAIVPGSYLFIVGMTLLLGFASQGGQAALYALVAEFYPTAIRATGTGWTLGIGRIGSILGPFVGGWILAWGWGLNKTFGLGAVLALCATAAVILRNRTGYHAPTQPSETDPSPGMA